MRPDIGIHRSIFTHVFGLCLFVGMILSTGCRTTQPTVLLSDLSLVESATQTTNDPPIQPVAYEASVGASKSNGSDEASTPQSLTLADLIRYTEERNPRLAQVAWAAEAARGQALQAGLYPNPIVSASGDELGDRFGPGGIWAAPVVSQELVTANKLGLSRTVALKDVDRASLAIVAERYRLFTIVRRDYWEVIALEKRLDILTELVGLAEESVKAIEKLQNVGEVARLDAVQLEVDRERYRAEREAVLRSQSAAVAKLAASVGEPAVASARILGSLDGTIPDYDLNRSRDYILGIHPELRSAQIGIERARAALERAKAEPYPNVTVAAGYIRQNQNLSHDWTFSASVPVPLWNRNQGNIHAERAALGEAINDIGRVQNELSSQLATAFQAYASARARADRYRTQILPKATESYQLAMKGRAGGQLDYLKVLQAQQALAEAKLVLIDSQTAAWQAAAEIAGLMLEDVWPNAPTAQK
jgi:cobalt-zinc-cadmium efflux system outer membrane protein